MTWGAINELTTLTGYRRLAALTDHPVLADLLERIVLDESRHFFFYYRQAELRLRRRGVARTARFLVDRFWAPVGSGVQPDAELRFLAAYLFGGPEGRAAARKVDETIRRLPGFETVQLLESWMDRHVGDAEPALPRATRRTQWPRRPLSARRDQHAPRPATTAPTPRAPSRAPSATRSRSSSAACTGASSGSCRRCWRAAATRRRSCRWPPRTISSPAARSPTSASAARPASPPATWSTSSRRKRRRPAPQDVNQKFVYLTAGSCGACRFGQYHQSYELALRNSGLDAFRMFLLAQDQLDQKAAMGDGLDLNLPVTLGCLWAIFCTDLVQDLEYQVRPYEVVPGPDRGGGRRSRSSSSTRRSGTGRSAGRGGRCSGTSPPATSRGRCARCGRSSTRSRSTGCA